MNLLQLLEVKETERTFATRIRYILMRNGIRKDEIQNALSSTVQKNAALVISQSNDVRAGTCEVSIRSSLRSPGAMFATMIDDEDEISDLLDSKIFAIREKLLKSFDDIKADLKPLKIGMNVYGRIKYYESQDFKIDKIPTKFSFRLIFPLSADGSVTKRISKQAFKAFIEAVDKGLPKNRNFYFNKYDGKLRPSLKSEADDNIRLGYTDLPLATRKLIDAEIARLTKELNENGNEWQKDRLKIKVKQWKEELAERAHTNQLMNDPYITKLEKIVSIISKEKKTPASLHRRKPYPLKLKWDWDLYDTSRELAAIKIKKAD